MIPFNKSFFTVCLLLLCGAFLHAQYCIPTNNCADGDQIQLFTIGGFSNMSACESDMDSLGYADFTALTGLEIPQSAPTSVTLQAGFGSQQVSIWIDSDNSMSFETSELILTDFALGTAPLTTEVTVPATVAMGTYRLRVQTSYNAASSTDACSFTSNFGETEDYTVTITAAPDCPAPSGLAIENILSDGATLTLTDNGSSNTFDVEVVAAGEMPTGTPTAGYDDVTGTSITITGLMPIQDYDVYVRADCGTEQSSFSGPISFTTGCAPVAPDYYTPFDDVPPACWEIAEGGSPETGPTGVGAFPEWTNDNFGNVAGGSNSAKVNLYNLGTDEWLISPEFDLTGGGFQVEYRFAVTQFANTNPALLGSDDEVYFLVTTDNGTSWETLDLITGESETSATGEIKIFDLAAYADQVVRFAFFATEGEVDDPEDNDIFVDDFRVRTPPSCLEAGDLSIVSINDQSVTILVGGGGAGDAETFDYILVPAGEDPGDTPTEELNDLPNPATINGLTEQTEYDLYVRVDCGGDDTNVSSFIGPLSFTTPCAAFDTPYLADFEDFLPACWSYGEAGTPTEGPDEPAAFSSWGPDAFGNTGSTSARVNLFASFVTDWLLTPSFNIPAGGGVQADFLIALTQYNDSAPGTLGSDDEIYFVVSNDAGQSYTILQVFDASTEISATGDLYEFNLDDYAGQTVQFGFYATDGAVDDPEDNDIYVDNFQVRMPPGCPDVASVDVDGVTSTTALVTVIEDSGEAIAYDLEIVLAGEDPTGMPSMGYDNVNASITITDLLPNTSYVVYARADCSDDNSSVGGYTASGEFTTACAPFEAPYSDDLNGELPDCWSEGTGGSLNGGPGNTNFGGWYSDVFGNIDGETNAFAVNLYTLSEDDWLISPFFATQSNGVYTVSFELALTNWNETTAGVLGSDDEVRLVYSTNGIDWNTALLYNSDSTALSTTGQQVSVDIDGVDGSLMFAFWATEGEIDDAEDIEFFVRNFMVTEEINIAPLSIVATNVTNVSCNGESDGAIELVVNGGTAPYTFSQDLSNLAAGTYTITVTDAMGMTLTTDPITITEPDAISASVVGTDETVAGDNDGTASVDNPTGGTGAYTYLWNNGATTQTITGLAPGDYCVTVVDANDCAFDAGCVTVLAGTSSTGDLETLRSLSTMPNPTDGNLRVALELSDVTDLDLQLTNALGQVVASRRFARTNEVQTDFDLSELPAGLYLLRVTDLNSDRFAVRRVIRE